MRHRLLTRLTGNRYAQHLLQKNVLLAQQLMGIGTGGSPSSSGERAVFRLMKRRCAAPYCVFDVGANAGQFLEVALAELKDSAHHVHCFEPARAAYQTLRERHGNARVTLNNVGLGREVSMRTLYYDAPGSGLASLSRRKLDHFGIHFGSSERVSLDTMDRYCAARGIESVSLLKVDVEGHELDVFAGATEMLRRGAVELVSFEFGGCNLDSRSTFRDFWYFFADLGMRLFRITPSGYLLPLPTYQEVDEQYRTTNFVATKG